MKVLVSIFKKLGHGFLSVLSRLKVFYQILLIISIMVGFIFLEGYLGLRVIDQLQDVTSSVFNQSIDAFQTINNAKDEMNKLKSEYLLILSDINHSVLVNTNSLFYQSVGLISLLSNIDAEEASIIYKEIQGIRDIFEKPASVGNYREVEKRLAVIKLALAKMEDKVLVSSAESMQFGKTFSANSRNTTIQILIVSILFSILLALMIAASVSNPLKSIVKAAKSLAVGNLAKNVSTQGCQEATEVVKGLNEAISGLRRLVGGINEQAQLLINASRELQEASSQSGRSATDVARAMEELAKASSEQANQVTQAVEIINELGILVRKVSADTERIAVVSEKVVESAKVGQEVTGNVANEINELYFSTKEVATVIEELNRASGEISEITSVIGGIAEQTTLLALNAAIEAARAGIQGKGFSVVAKETGKLADQSKHAAQMIADLIVQMNTKTSHAVEVIQKGISRVEAGKTLTTEATVTFESIFKELSDVLAQIEQVTHSARQMADKNESVINMVGGIATISEQSMASTEEVSATAQEQSASAQQVSSLAQNLATIANMLKESVAVFEIDNDNKAKLN